MPTFVGVSQTPDIFRMHFSDVIGKTAEQLGRVLPKM